MSGPGCIPTTPSKHAVPRLCAVAGYPTVRAGRWWRSVTHEPFVVSGVHYAISRMAPPGNVDSSAGPTPVGPTTPSAKEPPMGFAGPAIAQHPNASTAYAYKCAAMNVGCDCNLRDLR